MHRRHQKRTIPTELLRTLVAVVDTGSFTKAAREVDLTQAAVSNHMKRLQELLRGALFHKSRKGLRLTERGLVTLSHARRLLAINDQILDFAGPNAPPPHFRIGMPSWVAHARIRSVIKRCTEVAAGSFIQYRCDNLEVLLRDLSTGQLDAAFLCYVTDPPGAVVKQWHENAYWVAATDFKLMPGQAIPLITYAGSFTDRTAVKNFDAVGTQCTVVFSCQDMSARIAAAEAGLGVLLANERCVTPGLKALHELILPAPPTLISGIYTRHGLDVQHYASILQALTLALAPIGVPILPEGGERPRRRSAPRTRRAKLTAVHRRRALG